MEGYWEFPGGKLEEGEDPRDGLVREFEEELAVSVSVGRIEEVLLYRYPDRTVLLLFFWCRIIDGEPHPCLGQEVRWVTPDEMRELCFLPADSPIVDRLRAINYEA